MFIYNPEVKKFLRSYLILFIIFIALCFVASDIYTNIIKIKIVENNQAIVGRIVYNHPELEKEIVDIITQGKKDDKIHIGKSILKKYSYDENIGYKDEPIVSESIKSLLILNITLVSSIFILIMILIIYIFNKIYKDIKDMTEYVYKSSEGKIFNMKNKNQEGEIGLLKTELINMTTILKENVSLLNKEKVFLNDTISDISHQLRTPMTSLMILNDLMYDDIPKEVKIQFLDKIKSQLNRMDWLIKSMLKLSKVEAKVIDFKKEKINIKELIHKSIQPILVPMEIKNQILKIEGEDSYYVGDINWSVEALVNILKNCVEHTGEYGNINISYKENPLFSEIVIKDNGEGIEKNEIPNIFKRFFKGKSTSKEDSVGIGLAMAKSIIESQNGDIFVKSEKNKGTEFHITFHKRYSD